MAAAVRRNYASKADPINWRGLVSVVSQYLKQTYNAAGAASYADTRARGTFDQLNEMADEYARDRAAEMVGMKWVNGRLVPNPNAEWVITDTTRADINRLVQQAINEGMSPDNLAHEIEDLIDDANRAAMIAETEVAMAQEAASLEAWRASGVVSGKVWLLSNDHDSEDECDDNADAGVIGIDEEFPSGDDAPPAHPNCYCDIAAEVMEVEDEDAA